MNMYDPYNQFPVYVPYFPETEEPPRRGTPWAFLIISSIIALVDVYFWLPFYRACQAYDHNIFKAMDEYTKAFAIFAGIALVFFVFSVITLISFAKIKKFWGRSFGNFLGKLILFLEYAAYVVAVLLFFF